MLKLLNQTDQGAGRHALPGGLPGALLDAPLSGQIPESLHALPEDLQGDPQSRLLGGRALGLLALMYTRGNTLVVIQDHPPVPVVPLILEAIHHTHVHHLAPHPPHTPAPLPVHQDPEGDDPTPQHHADLDLIQALQGGEG